MDIAGAINKLSPREKTISAFTVIVLLALLPYMFIYSPPQEQIKVKRHELNTLNNEITALSSALRLKVGQEQAVDMPVITLPEANDLAGMIEAISREANRAGVEFISISQEGLSDRGQYVEMRLKLELRARYKPFYKFIRQLGDRHRLFIIQSLRYETNAALYPSGVGIMRAKAYLRRK